MEAFDGKRKCISVVIETPKGSRMKYSYEETAVLEVKKALPEGMMFPFISDFSRALEPTTGTLWTCWL
jgi:inorganic pyrophosphatase